MSNKAKARKIFDRWKSYLSQAERNYDAISSNFDELFYDFAKISIPSDIAKTFLNEAIGAHLPNQSVAKWTYKRMDKNVVGSFIEFFDNWKKTITDKANVSFYEMYPFEEDKQEEKTYGNMSKQEYVKQRRYADSYRVIDVNDIPELEIIDEDLEFEDGYLSTGDK